MRNVLILHHLEPMWETGYKRAGTSFYRMCEKVIDHLNDHRYKRIILTRFEDSKLDQQHYEAGLANVGMQIDVYEYGYGWDAAQIVDYPDDFIEGGSHSEAVMIADWMRDLPKAGVYLAGAFDGECIEDMEIALRSLKVKFTRIEDLIV
jgi:hypothetical protein